MALTIKQRVKIACDISNIKMSMVAEQMGMSPSSFTQRLSRGKSTKQDLMKIAEIIGCEYRSSFVFPSGKSFSAPLIGDQIMGALVYSGMTIAELGGKLGLVYADNVKGRMSTGKFTQEELEMLASYMGCTYISEFVFKDGTVI